MCAFDTTITERAAVRLVVVLFLSVLAIILLSDGVVAQPNYPAAGRTAAMGDPTTPSVIDPASALGKALEGCNRNEATSVETFSFPGLKGEVTLDRCYKGHAHLICVLMALQTEATSLTKSYTKIVEAKYPELATVDGICRISSDTLATDIAGAEDFAKRFNELKSQYEAATKCVANVEQAFKGVSFSGLTDGPQVLQSITSALDIDVAKISKVQNQIADLSAKVELANRVMKKVTKIHRVMCVKANGAQNGG